MAGKTETNIVCMGKDNTVKALVTYKSGKGVRRVDVIGRCNDDDVEAFAGNERLGGFKTFVLKLKSVFGKEIHRNDI